MFDPVVDRVRPYVPFVASPFDLFVAACFQPRRQALVDHFRCKFRVRGRQVALARHGVASRAIRAARSLHGEAAHGCRPCVPLVAPPLDFLVRRPGQRTREAWVRKQRRHVGVGGRKVVLARDHGLARAHRASGRVLRVGAVVRAGCVDMPVRAAPSHRLGAAAAQKRVGRVHQFRRYFRGVVSQRGSRGPGHGLRSLIVLNNIIVS